MKWIFFSRFGIYSVFCVFSVVCMTVAHVHGSQKAYLDMQFVYNRNNEPFLHMNWMSRALIIHTIPMFKHFGTFGILNTTGAQLVEYDTKLHHKMCLYSFESKTSKLVDVSAVEIVLYQWMNEANERKTENIDWLWIEREPKNNIIDF